MLKNKNKEVIVYCSSATYKVSVCEENKMEEMEYKMLDITKMAWLAR